MKNYKYIIVSICFVMILASCNKTEVTINNYNYNQKDSSASDTQNITKILGHRGSGNTGSGIYIENTLPSVINAMDYVNGVEIDIQMSKDGTLWLYHDSKLYDCGDLSFPCIPTATDDQITSIDNCFGDSIYFTRLEEVFKYYSDNNLEKFISLDVKGYFGDICSIDDIYLENMAKEVIKLVNKYNLSKYVMVETDYKVFLDYVVQNDNNIDCYLLSYSDLKTTIDKALSRNYNGISFRYSDTSLTVSNMIYLRNNNLKIQLWTVNFGEDIENIFQYNPDFIQTDNIYYDFDVLKQGQQEL